VDPCGLKYLVGNGAQSGRGGYCSDELDEGVSGPRLVVLPAAHGSGRYAMTKHEVTWADFNLFCLESDSCGLDPGDDRMPVTGVDFAIADAYASWLTRHTGFRYRLPTADEWQWAARGQPDPNRNCRVQLDGVERGLGPVAVTGGQVNEFGLVHMLGNVQEWVVDAERIRVVGGAYSDPIQDCVAQTSREHGGKADVSTGFRLVREIS
jgi:formylglycine-generating enzyme required for sulfatase activity